MDHVQLTISRAAPMKKRATGGGGGARTYFVPPPQPPAARKTSFTPAPAAAVVVPVVVVDTDDEDDGLIPSHRRRHSSSRTLWVVVVAVWIVLLSAMFLMHVAFGGNAVAPLIAFEAPAQVGSSVNVSITGSVRRFQVCCTMQSNAMACNDAVQCIVYAHERVASCRVAAQEWTKSLCVLFYSLQ